MKMIYLTPKKEGRKQERASSCYGFQVLLSLQEHNAALLDKNLLEADSRVVKCKGINLHTQLGPEAGNEVSTAKC